MWQPAGKMKEEDVSPESHVPSGNLKTVKRGAMELKQHLQQVTCYDKGSHLHFFYL